MKQIGRAKRKPKNKRYWDEGHRFKNKIKRILKSEGETAADRYRRAHLRR